jgi:predicted alpha/beta superfamily hydrolase
LILKRLFLFCLLAIGHFALLAQVKVIVNITGLPKKSVAPNDIYLAGSFNMWNPASKYWELTDNNSHYSGTFTLAPGNYDYKLTRGSWPTVECGIAGVDIGNRSLHVVHDTTLLINVTEWKDNYPQTIVRKHTASKNVHIVSEAFNMPQLGTHRRVWIYLPNGYETARKKYPVIYMHDGQNLFDEYTGNFGEWGVDEFLDSLKTNQQQFIVVGIDNGESLRMAEYSPYDSEYAKGTGDAYVRFLVETLKPYIDTHYRTLTDAKHTTIAGSSMGGLISMYAIVKYPKVFGNAGIFSPAFWVNPNIYDYAKTAAIKGSRYYFVCGDMESDKEAADMYKMVDILAAKGFAAKDIPTTIIKGAKHNEQQWRSDMPGFYRWLVSK